MIVVLGGFLNIIQERAVFEQLLLKATYCD